MRILQVEDPFIQQLTPLTKEEQFVLLEKRKRSCLHELKILSERMKEFMDMGWISQMGDEHKYEDFPRIPDSETRRLLTKDTQIQKKVLRTCARFALVREIFSNSVMPEFEALETELKDSIAKVDTST